MADNTRTRLGQIMKSRLLRKHLGEQVVIIWFIVWKRRLYLHYFTIYLHIINMPTSCCVPQCNEKGFTTQKGEKYRIFPFQACFYKESSGFTPFTAKRKKTSKFPQALQKSVHFILDLKIFENLWVAEFTLPMVLFHRSLRGPFYLHVKERHQLFASH